MTSLIAWDLNALLFAGPNPFSNPKAADPQHIGAIVMAVEDRARPIRLRLKENRRGAFDGGYRLAAPTAFGDRTYDRNHPIEMSCSYLLRRRGRPKAADTLTLHVLEIDGAPVGVATDTALSDRCEYEFFAIDRDDALLTGGSLVGCFGSGTRIATPGGTKAVEDLAVGDLVQTLDHGPQALVWTGQRTVTFSEGEDRQTPILVRAGSLGRAVPSHDLVVSPQLRFLLGGMDVEAAFGSPEVLATANGLLPLQGVRSMTGQREMTFHSLLLRRHEILIADGALAESFYPAPFAMKTLGQLKRAQIRALFPRLIDDPENGYGPTARPIIKRRQAAILAKRLRRTCRWGMRDLQITRTAEPLRRTG